jgi:hypothetical protein
MEQTSSSRSEWLEILAASAWDSSVQNQRRCKIKKSGKEEEEEEG